MVTSGTNYTKKHSRDRGLDSRKDKVVIADPAYDNEIVYYHCDACSLNVGVRLSNQQEEIVCSRCGETIAVSKARKVSKLTTPHQNTETLIADPRTVYSGSNLSDSVKITKHELPLEWGAKSLSQKDTIKFTDYKEG